MEYFTILQQIKNEEIDFGTLSSLITFINDATKLTGPIILNTNLRMHASLRMHDDDYHHEDLLIIGEKNKTITVTNIINAFEQINFKRNRLFRECKDENDEECKDDCPYLCCNLSYYFEGIKEFSIKINNCETYQILWGT